MVRFPALESGSREGVVSQSAGPDAPGGGLGCADPHSPGLPAVCLPACARRRGSGGQPVLSVSVSPDGGPAPLGLRSRGPPLPEGTEGTEGGRLHLSPGPGRWLLPDAPRAAALPPFTEAGGGTAVSREPSPGRCSSPSVCGNLEAPRPLLWFCPISLPSASRQGTLRLGFLRFPLVQGPAFLPGRLSWLHFRPAGGSSPPPLVFSTFLPG